MLLKRFKTGRISKQLLTYLVEVIIIFLGITISFLFEQWREEKQQQKELVELSESLLTDINALKTKLTDDLGGSADWISQLDSLRIQRNAGKISERQLGWFCEMVTGQNMFLFDPYSPTYMSATGSGLTHELPDSIRSQLYELYRIRLPFFQLLYDQQHESITNFRNHTMVPGKIYLYRTDASPIRIDFNLLAKEVNQPVYGNFINQIILTEQKVYQLNEEAFVTLNRLQGSLQNYINKVEE
jgi:uncharacterized protein YjiS (DUF1127 family)